MSETEILSYADAFSARAGERLNVRMSTAAELVRVRTLRLRHGDTNPAGPGLKVEPVDMGADGEVAGRLQPTDLGSYAIAEAPAALDAAGTVTIQCWIHPTRPASGAPQGIVTRWTTAGHGFGLFLDAEGHLEARMADGGSAVIARSDAPLVPSRWYCVVATLDRRAGRAAIAHHVHRAGWPPSEASTVVAARPSGVDPAAGHGAPLLIGAGFVEHELGRRVSRGHYDGKVARPRIWACALDAEAIGRLAAGADPLGVRPDDLVAAWDPAADIVSTTLADVSANGSHATLVNMPARGVTDHTWDGSATHPALAPDQYGAVHFHGDDMSDCGWDVGLELDIPAGTPSGAYAVELKAGDATDHCPFIVRPPTGRPTAPILVVMPTFTYLAYGNERIAHTAPDLTASGIFGLGVQFDPQDLLTARHAELGLSLYDIHADGSGSCYASSRRPILNFRPSYRNWQFGAPRGFSADLYLIDWLEEKGLPYDVVTDHDLHHDGAELLAPYRTVITGGHPEYCSAEMIGAMEQYLGAGGSLMYLGGNGFYWVTSVDPEQPHIIEVRRGVAGTRTYNSPPGEEHHSTTGERGGLWRHRGRAPNQLVGVGFAAEGWSPKARPFDRTPESHDPRVAFIFDGVSEEPIGDFGLAMDGAGGDEIDRFDVDNGSPHDTLVVAVASGFTNHYQVTIEDVKILTPNPGYGGEQSPLVRGDMTYLETPGGGRVFSAGSICWLGGLSHAGYDNDVSRITENVLRHFSGIQPPERRRP